MRDGGNTTEMNPILIIVPTSALLAIAGVIRLYGKLAQERAKRIQAVQQVIEAREERDEWQETAYKNLEWWRKLVGRLAKSRHEATKQAEQIDSLLHGDRRCVNSHRYYTGQGISCPHCGAAEVVTRKECNGCGKTTPVSGLTDGYCAACYIPF